MFLLVKGSFAFTILGKLNHKMLFISNPVVTSVAVSVISQILLCFHVFTSSLIKQKCLSAIDTQWTNVKLHNVQVILQFQATEQIATSSCLGQGLNVFLLRESCCSNWANFQLYRNKDAYHLQEFIGAYFFTHQPQIAINVSYNK